MKERVQKFGRFLSGMVMPNIGAFIAWGLIAAFFIPDGWFPNETINGMVGPMLRFLLPILIGYTAGCHLGLLRHHPGRHRRHREHHVHRGYDLRPLGRLVHQEV